MKSGWTAILRDQLENLFDGLAENARNANGRFKTRSNIPTLQTRHIGASHLQPERQLGFFNSPFGQALGQLIFQQTTHIALSLWRVYTICKHLK